MLAAVETLNVLGAPPVPQVSTSVSGSVWVGMRATFSRITLAAPTSSSAVGTRSASSASSAPISAGVTSPAIIAAKVSRLSSVG